MTEFDPETREEAGLVWSEASFPIDGDEVPFQITQADEAWAAPGRWNDLAVKLRGDRFPIKDVKLTVIWDVQPYLNGSEQMKTWWQQKAGRS